jgi:hypothetical protein
VHAVFSVRDSRCLLRKIETKHAEPTLLKDRDECSGAASDIQQAEVACLSEMPGGSGDEHNVIAKRRSSVGGFELLQPSLSAASPVVLRVKARDFIGCGQRIQKETTTNRTTVQFENTRRGLEQQIRSGQRMQSGGVKAYRTIH